MNLRCVLLIVLLSVAAAIPRQRYEDRSLFLRGIFGRDGIRPESLFRGGDLGGRGDRGRYRGSGRDYARFGRGLFGDLGGIGRYRDSDRYSGSLFGGLGDIGGLIESGIRRRGRYDGLDSIRDRIFCEYVATFDKI